MISIAAPPFAHLRAEGDSKAAVSRARSLFAYARQTALLTGRRVTLCALDEKKACTRNWNPQRHIAVFLDKNGNHALNHGEPVLRKSNGINTQGSLKWRASLGRRHLAFEAFGGTWQNGTLIYCPRDKDSRHARALIISHTGRSYLSKDNDGDGVRENRTGKNIDCKSQ